ncbi:trihelix transcription factor PTL-like [Humulus lupulus]|uniref:trihelix transcription factor PTL-like n=1 Tax=Humulus lupulus TaxID=3486 RepID=UPI002B40B504|nr:trihelix transcription factor PTL-like [Humulus lupulus]
MEDQFVGIPAEFRQLMAMRTEQPQPLISPARPHLQGEPFYQQSYGQTSSLGGVGLVDHQFGSGHHNHHHFHHRFSTSSSTATAAAINMSGSNGVALYHHDFESSSGTHHGWMSNNIGSYENNTNTTRWPRQETLTLLEIRSRLNSRFKDTNQKGPLWDQISRIMAEEHGYQRSGKKCKEKFENLYKYYKKTKEGKARKQDGKHYRFFRQLEAIYGDQNSNQSPVLETHLSRSSLLYTDLGSQEAQLNLDHHRHHQYPTQTKLSDNNNSLSFSINNSSDQFETSSSDNGEDRDRGSIKMDDDHQKMKGVVRPSRKKSSWKAKVEEFVDSQMKKIMETQETWMEKMFQNVMDKEEKRVAEEEECRKKEAAQFDQKINEFWAREKAWIEARDAAVMGALNKVTSGKGSSLLQLPSFPERLVLSHNKDRIATRNYVHDHNNHRWNEEEISSFIELIRSTNCLGGASVEGSVGFISKENESVWVEIASKMACLGFERSPAECKEKWESLSVQVRMINESNKKRREDFNTSTCTTTPATGYSDHDRDHHQDYHKGFNHHDDQHQDHDDRTLKQDHHHRIMGLRLMDEGLSPSSASNVGTTQMNPSNCFNLLFGEGENLWEKYGSLKLGKDRINEL